MNDISKLIQGKNLSELDEKIVTVPGEYDFVKVQAIDLSSQFDEKPTQEKLKEVAKEYIKQKNVGVPKVSLTISFSQLEQSEEYKSIKLLERVSLFDTVNVEFPELNVSVTAKVVKVVYDSLLDRVKYITLGSTRASISDTISTQTKLLKKYAGKEPVFMER